MSNVKKVIICILAIALVVLAAKTNVFATEDIFNVFATGNENVNNNANTANASEHADAGVDYSIVFIIAICGVSAVYAYRKIRQYNV